MLLFTVNFWEKAKIVVIAHKFSPFPEIDCKNG